jgi:hypothetical protein
MTTAVSQRLKLCHELLERMCKKIRLQADIAKQGKNVILQQMYIDIVANLEGICTCPESTAVFIEEYLLLYWKKKDNVNDYYFDVAAMRESHKNQTLQMIQTYEQRGYKFREGAIEKLTNEFDNSHLFKYFEAMCDTYTTTE